MVQFLVLVVVVDETPPEQDVVSEPIDAEAFIDEIAAFVLRGVLPSEPPR